MLKRVTPVRFDRPTDQGRTTPSFLMCETEDGEHLEVVAKFSKGCEEGALNLAREVICACLAADLSLPIPEPVLIVISDEWADTIPDNRYRTLVKASSPIAFGSKRVSGGYTTWTDGHNISDELLPVAAAIFLFDALIQNPDRRPGNANCLVKGERVVIFDHELAFSQKLIIGWKEPWKVGGLNSLENNRNHIFRGGLSKRSFDHDNIAFAWSILTDAQIASYASALPNEWAAASVAEDAIKLISGCRDNLDGCVQEMKRVLS